jgi:G3E family GTPase
MENIRVHIISGFLGAGKTTAISKILKAKNNNEQWAVIVNEFGRISIDSQTIASSSSAGTVYEISGGCICCSASAYFQDNLEKIVNTGIYKRIIIEPSGLGGIEMVSGIINSMNILRLMPVICIVDITSIENMRLQLNQIYKAQIANAEFIVFSKCDLPENSVKVNHLIEKFKTMFPEKANVLNITDENVWSSLLYIESEKKEDFEKCQSPLIKDSGLMAGNYFEHSIQYQPDIIFDSIKLTELFFDCAQIVRAKGHVQTETGWNLFNSTLETCTFEPCPVKAKSELILISSESGVFKTIKNRISLAVKSFVNQELS